MRKYYNNKPNRILTMSDRRNIQDLFIYDLRQYNYLCIDAHIHTHTNIHKSICTKTMNVNTK